MFLALQVGDVGELGPGSDRSRRWDYTCCCEADKNDGKADEELHVGSLPFSFSLRKR
jgi:hypothetical protein